MKAYGEMVVCLHAFLSLALYFDAVLHALAAWPPGQAPFVPIALEVACDPELVWMLCGGGKNPLLLMGI